MEHDGIITKFKPELLDGLLDDENSCVEVYKKHKQHVTLLPYHLFDLNESLTSILDRGISKYSKKYNGVLLAHKNIKVLPTKSVVNREYIYIHMDIEADFYIFKPEIDKVLNGVVNKYSARHVGALIYNTFNVSIPKPKSDDNWLGDQVNIGQEVVLRINFINYEARLPYITAELISIKENQNNKSNKIIFNSDSEPDDSQVKVKKKKKKSKDLCEESLNNDIAEETLDSNVQKRKKIKEDFSITEFNFTDENDVNDVESTKKRKRKREKSFEINDLDTASTENDENVTKKRKRRSKENNLLDEEGNISRITKLEMSLDKEVTQSNEDVTKKKEKKKHSIIQQDLNYENDQNSKKNKMKLKKCYELEENTTEIDVFSYDFDKPLNLENLIDNKNISAMSNSISSVDYNIKKILNKNSNSSGTDSSIVNLKKEILYDSEVEHMMKDFGFKSEPETTKKRKKSSIVNYDIEDVKSKKIKTEH